jgi:hypothetical protein
MDVVRSCKRPLLLRDSEPALYEHSAANHNRSRHHTRQERRSAVARLPHDQVLPENGLGLSGLLARHARPHRLEVGDKPGVPREIPLRLGTKGRLPSLLAASKVRFRPPGLRCWSSRDVHTGRYSCYLRRAKAARLSGSSGTSRSTSGSLRSHSWPSHGNNLPTLDPITNIALRELPDHSFLFMRSVGRRARS